VETERFEAGQVIFRQGEPGDRFYIVVRGQVDVLTTDPAGRERRLSTLTDGDYFGEIALLEEVPRTATIRARTSVVCLTLERKHFLDLVAATPDLRADVEQVVASRREAGLAVIKTQPPSVATH
jgi:ATP-binding cassette subfamily B protein